MTRSFPLNSLGIAKPPARTRVVVAMSGGVDSATVAALLAGEGYDVLGITLQLYDHGAATGKKGACCAGQDIYDARRVAARLGIPHYVLDYEARFARDVIHPFAQSYEAGMTPIPCILCNQTVKFTDLLDHARDLDADAVATGHYIRRLALPAGPALYRAADQRRDQSYFLFSTTAEQLALLRFPLGDIDKGQTRALARRAGIAVADKADSQDICFVPNGDYRHIVEKLRPDAASPGEIVHMDGRVLGRHQGILNFTVGQRRGLGLDVGAGEGDPDPLYVVRIDAGQRRVIVGPRAALARVGLETGPINWLGEGSLPPAGAAVLVKLRSASPLVPARLYPLADGGLQVELETPQEAIAPGQACVIYRPDSHGERLLGGGWIRREAGEPKAPATGQANLSATLASTPAAMLDRGEAHPLNAPSQTHRRGSSVG